MGASAPVKYHYFHHFFTYPMRWKQASRPTFGFKVPSLRADLSRKQCQVGSLAALPLMAIQGLADVDV